MSDDERKKKVILDTLDDTVSRLLYYDRKEDSELPVGAIEQAVRQGVVTIDELVEKFDRAITEACLRAPSVFVPVSDSDKLFDKATLAVRSATGCTQGQANAVVRGIAAYVARFSAEIASGEGPAHEWAKAHGI